MFAAARLVTIARPDRRRVRKRRGEAPPGWPLVLAGPLVRRVEEASASVFVACRDPVTVRLSIYDGTGPGRAAVATAHAGTVPLGRFLHVAVVTARPERPLDPGRRYGYDLEFAGHGGLGSLGLLDALGYEPGAPAQLRRPARAPGGRPDHARIVPQAPGWAPGRARHARPDPGQDARRSPGPAAADVPHR